MAALKDLNDLLWEPSKGKGGGYKAPDLDPFVRFQLEGMCIFLNFYMASQSTTWGQWASSLFHVAVGLGKGHFCARSLWHLTSAYIWDQEVLSINPYGDWNESMLVDENLVADINLYLQELGNYITASKLVQFLARPDVKEKHGIIQPISEMTALQYLKALGYHFTPAKKGQYADGHKHEDVVIYCNQKFLFQLAELQK